MPVALPTSRLFYGGFALGAMYQGDTKVWEPEGEAPPDGAWGPDESMLDPAVIPVTTYTGAYTTGARFLCTADGQFTHLRSYNCDPTGTAFLRIWNHTVGPTLLAEVTVPSALGWHDYPLVPPVPAIKAHEYTLSFYNQSVPTYPYAASQPVSQSPHLINYDSPHMAGDSYPTTFGGECYWLDVVYQEAAAVGYDPATAAFIAASGLDQSYAPALDVLVVGLKSAGLWSKMLAVYPFIGGTDALHKWNLIDPRDTDDAYRLTFYGTGTHTAVLGYQPAPTGQYTVLGYADTHLVPSSVMDLNSTHLSLYSLEARPNGARCDMGSYNWDGAMNRFHVIAHYMSGEFYYSMSSLTMAQTPGGESTGLFVSTRTTNSDFAGYHNGTLAAAAVDPATSLPYVPMSIGHLTGFDMEYSDLPLGFASLGAGLNDQDVADLYLAVQAYQETLGRQTPKTYWEEP